MLGRLSSTDRSLRRRRRLATNPGQTGAACRAKREEQARDLFGFFGLRCNGRVQTLDQGRSTLVEFLVPFPDLAV